MKGYIFLIIGVIILSQLSLIHAEDTKQSTDLFGWIYNSITGLWENWFGDKVIETNLINPLNNSKTYDSIKKEVTIIDKSSVEVSKIKLITPLNYYVLEGKDVKVAEFQIDNFKDYDNVFEKIEFYNKLNNQAIDRTFKYKYKSTEDYLIDVPTYSNCTSKIICADIPKEYSNPNCKEKVEYIEVTYVCENGTKKETAQREVWKDLEQSKIDKLFIGKLTIGIFTDTYKNDKVEWIPTFFGVKINEWADWTTADCNSSVTATNVTLSLNNDWCVYTYLQRGTFDVISGSLNTSVLVVAGGGSGGSSDTGSGGGGGAGGLIYNNSYIVSGNYIVTVGVGGVYVKNVRNNGTNSTFGTLDARGGGCGAPGKNTGPTAGCDGGSGGGGQTSGGALTLGGAGTAGQGNYGGGNGAFIGAPYPTGGGGGAGRAGSNATANNIAGKGGDGLQINITGTPKWYAGGGAGSYFQATGNLTYGGLGGGGNGTVGSGTGQNGINGTGGGGGGSQLNGPSGSGGSGVVIVSFQLTGGSDTTYPQFTNNLTSITNGSQYRPGNGYYFNITISNTNGTTGIQFNNVNYTLSNISNSFYKDVGSLSVGTYSYYYWAYGNGSSHLFNNSQTFSYTVIRNNSYDFYTSMYPSNNVVYPTITLGQGFSFNLFGCNNGLVCKLYRDNIEVTNPDYLSLGAGYYNYTWNTTGNTNYSTRSDSTYLNVEKGSRTCKLNNNLGSWGIDYTQSLDIYISCNISQGINQGDITFTRDGTNVSNPDHIFNPPASSYDYYCYIGENANYSACIQG